MNILITGGTGYAGFHAAIALRNAGHSVKAMVRQAKGERAQQLLPEEVQLLEGDITRPETYRAALTECDALVHTVMDFADPQGSDLALFEAMNETARLSPKSRRFVYTTGCSIYGKVAARVMDETTPGNPAHALFFRMEMEQKVLNGLSGWRKTVVRPGFMYGKEARSSMSGRWFAMGASGEVVFRGDCDKGWSWVHIEDLARAYVLVVEAGADVDGEVFCLADEARPRCLEVMTACARATGFDGEVTFGAPTAEDWTGTVFDQNEFITSRKAARLLGWTPRHTGILDDIPTLYAAWKAGQGAASR